MPRNGSGTYSLPAGNPVVSGTTIQASWANSTLADISTELTGSLARSGAGGMLGALRGVDGTVSVPAFSFTSETTSGFYRAGTGDVRFAMAGADVYTVTTSGIGIGTTSIGSGTRLEIRSANTITDSRGILAINSTNAAAANLGGSISFGGETGQATTPYVFGAISGRYEGSGYAGYLQLSTTTIGGVVTERARIDSSGNLGLGVTPSAWNQFAKAIQIADTGAGIWSFTSGGTSAEYAYFVNNSFLNSSGIDIYVRDGEAAQYRLFGGTHAWFTAPSGTAGNSISFSQVMSLNAGGVLTLGSNIPALNVGSSAVSTGDCSIELGAGRTGSGNSYIDLTGDTTYTDYGLRIIRNNGGANTASTITHRGTGALQLITEEAAPITFVTSGGSNERMRLDASGNLGVGTSSPQTKVHISGASTTSARVGCTGGSGVNLDLTATSTEVQIGSPNGVALLFNTTNTERARITSGGDLLVGLSAATFVSTRLEVQAATNNNGLGSKTTQNNYAPLMAWNSATTGDNLFQYFYTEGTLTLRGSIDYNRAGGLVRYNTTSDYRAKDIIGPVQNPGATIDALKVYEGKMKGATQSRPMLIAHEAQEHAPYAVSGIKDEVNEDGTPKFQQMDVSSLVPLLLAEIQSLRARVAALEAA